MNPEIEKAIDELVRATLLYGITIQNEQVSDSVLWKSITDKRDARTKLIELIKKEVKHE
jgi:hypothetical protein